MRQLCWIGAVAAAAVAHESLWAASAGGLVHADAWAVTPALAQTAAACRIIWAGLLLATGMITNIGFGTVADLQATDPARAETVWLARRRRRPSVR